MLELSGTVAYRTVADISRPRILFFVPRILPIFSTSASNRAISYSASALTGATRFRFDRASRVLNSNAGRPCRNGRTPPIRFLFNPAFFPPPRPGIHALTQPVRVRRTS